MYFLFIRPQAQARKKAEAMLAALKKGDEVMTAGGIVGKVRDIKESLHHHRDRHGAPSWSTGAASCASAIRSAATGPGI